MIDSSAVSIAHAIQLAVAPVFLLTGIGAVLNVLANRLSRIIDRARVLQTNLPLARPPDHEAMQRELRLLSQRARLINWSISLCTACALLICAVISILFAGEYLDFDFAAPLGLLFVTAMLMLFTALLSFLREVYVATRNLRIGPA